MRWAGGIIVTDAIKYQGQMEHLNITEKKLLQDIITERSQRRTATRRRYEISENY
jgi:hypothetical protein